MGTLLIKQARLEYGFHDEVGKASSTLTKLQDILITNGTVTEINDLLPATKHMHVIDAEGALLTPSFREMHIHIDKTYFGGPWKASKPMTKGILTRIEEEEKLLPQQLQHAPERAEKMIQHLIDQGHTHIRTHCNIDPSIGLNNLEVTVNALEKYKDQITYDIVAFPQHGLLRSEVTSLMREAMQHGATLVGGVDPATIDRDIDTSLETTFAIAQEYKTGIDLHLHDPDSLGAFTFYKVIDLTKQHNMQGNVTISHAPALADLQGEAFTHMVQALEETGIDITTTIPINRPTIPVTELYEANINVSVGHDSLTDHWSPFGTGNTIEKLSVLAERFKISDERGLHDVWKFASGGKTPLNTNGEHVWPTVGDPADMLLIDATCTAEAVARRKPITHVVSSGTVIRKEMQQ